LQVRFHLIVGRYETAMNRDDSSPINYLDSQRRFVDALRNKNYTVSYAEYPEGHQWGFWKAHVGEALQFFCGG
jgi:enterochelin esterase-like enzyme